MMKKLLLLLFVLISFDAFSQLHVKEGSFKHVPNAVMNDKADRYDDNDEPMALIRISTVNINETERMRINFKSNRATQIVKEYLNGQVWLYLSHVADFLEISHPDYSLITYKLPETLRGHAIYEMTLEYVSPQPQPQPIQTPVQQKKYPLIVKADQSNATIYIDDEPLDVGEAYQTVDEGTSHTYKIECNLYHTETGTVTVNERTVIEKKLRPAFGYINVSTSPEQGAKVFVDGNYLGVSPIKTDKLKSGSHTVRVMKEMYKMKEQSFTVTDGQTTNATLNMAANFVTLTVDTDTDSDIYIDEEYKGKGRWVGRLSDGSHIFEARKQNHKPTQKTLDLVLGATKTVTLETPTPINGSCEISSSPMGATIYIDGKNYGETPNYINEIIIGTHELKLTKQGCTTVTKTIIIKEGETLNVNEKLQTGKEIAIKTDKSGDRIYIDGNYVGLSPITSSLSFGSHEIKAERDGKTVSKNIEVSQVEVHGRVSDGGSSEEYVLTFTQEINGHEYVDLGLSVKWATCNVGASSPEDYGDYYAWGETKTKSKYSEFNSVTYGKKISDIKGNVRYDAARANWGGTWRLPTKTEFEELKNKCTWQWTTQNGKNGYKITGPNGNHIFLPAAGGRDGSSLYYAGCYGYYWSSTPHDYNDDYGAYYLGFNDGYESAGWGIRDYGHAVRPITE